MQFKYLAVLALSALVSAQTATPTAQNPYAALTSLVNAAEASVSNTAPNPGHYGAAVTSIHSKEAGVAASISHDIQAIAASMNATAHATAFGYSSLLAQASAAAATDLERVASTLFNAAPAATVMPGIFAAVGGAAAMLLL